MMVEYKCAKVILVNIYSCLCRTSILWACQVKSIYGHDRNDFHQSAYTFVASGLKMNFYANYMEKINIRPYFSDGSVHETMLQTMQKYENIRLLELLRAHRRATIPYPTYTVAMDEKSLVTARQSQDPNNFSR